MYSTPSQYYPLPHQYQTFLPPVESDRHHFAPGLEHNSWALASAAAAVGSLVGLSAAAATRWWNGDDWYLVVPEPTETNNATPEKASVDNDLPRINESIGEANSDSKFTYEEGRGKYTNRAMELLRQQQLQPETIFKEESLSELRDIQKSLASIQLELSNSPLLMNECDGDTDASRNPLIFRLNTILVKLESILGIDNCDVPSHEPVEPPDFNLEPRFESAADSANPLSTQTVMEANTIDSEAMVSDLRQALAQLVLGKDGPSVSHAQFISGIQLLYLYSSNISNHPHVPRYRRIYCENESYRQNVEKLSGAAALLEAIGFHLGQNSKYWEWMAPASPASVDESWNDVERLYLERAREAVSALKVLKVASEAVDKEDLLKSALHAARLDDNAHLGDKRSSNMPNPHPSQAILGDTNDIASQSIDTPFVCDTDLVTTEVVAILTATSDADFQTKETNETPSDENERISESDVWK
jgi:PUB domain